MSCAHHHKALMPTSTPATTRQAQQRVGAGALGLGFWAAAVPLTLTLSLSGAPVAQAQMQQPMAQASEGLRPEQLLGLVRHAVELAGQQAQAQQSQHTPGLRIETEVGQFDAQLKLAPCQVAEPYLPVGTRPWGNIRIGLRCTQGPVRWNVFVPAQIRVYAPVVVAATPLVAGQAIQPQDVVVAEAEISAEAGNTLQDPQLAAGRLAAQNVRAGQALRSQHLRSRQWFAAGEAVTMVAKGPGFQISSEGVALSPGVEGQSVRVRMEGGRVVSGVPVGARRVEVTL